MGSEFSYQIDWHTKNRSGYHTAHAQPQQEPKCL